MHPLSMAVILATTKLAAAILAAATIFSMVEAAAQPSYTLTPLRLPAAPTCEMHGWRLIQRALTTRVR